jgi:hypothetical protein
MSEERWSKKRVQGKNHLFVVEEENRVRLPPITRSDTTGEGPGRTLPGYSLRVTVLLHLQSEGKQPYLRTIVTIFIE